MYGCGLDVQTTWSLIKACYKGSVGIYLTSFDLLGVLAILKSNNHMAHTKIRTAVRIVVSKIKVPLSNILCVRVLIWWPPGTHSIVLTGISPYLDAYMCLHCTIYSVKWSASIAKDFMEVDGIIPLDQYQRLDQIQKKVIISAFTWYTERPKHMF